jgi:hypothetical protein
MATSIAPVPVPLLLARSANQSHRKPARTAVVRFNQTPIEGNSARFTAGTLSTKPSTTKGIAMLTLDDQQAVREIVSETIRSELQCLTFAVLRPITEQLALILENQRHIAQGQMLVEKHLADCDDDNEPWRESLD